MGIPRRTASTNVDTKPIRRQGSSNVDLKVIRRDGGVNTVVYNPVSLPTFTPGNAGLNVSNGVTGDAVSYTISAGTKVSISPATYQSGSNTYTAVVTVPSGYSNSGGTVSPTDTATGGAKQYTATFVGTDSIDGTNHETSNLTQDSQSGPEGGSYAFSDLSATANPNFQFDTGPTTSGDDVSGTFGTSDVVVNREITGTTGAEKFGGSITYLTAAQVSADNMTPESYSNEVPGATVSYSGTIDTEDGYVFQNDTSSKDKSGSITVPSGGGNVDVDFLSDTAKVDCSSVSTTPTEYTFTNSNAQSLLPLVMNGSNYASNNLPQNSFISLSGSSGDSSVTLSLTKNTGDARNFDLKITHANTCVSTVPISQTAFVTDSITLPADVTIDADGVTDQAVSITTGGDGALTIEDNMLWLTISDVTATGFKFTATENTGEQRSATITGTKGAESDTMKVTQAAADGSFTCSFWTFTASGNFNVIQYTTCAGTVVKTTSGTLSNVCIRDGSTSVISGNGTWSQGNSCS